MVLKMREDAVDVIDRERAADALRDRTRSHHEVLDEQLAATIEQAGQCHFAVRRIENVFLLHFDPWQVAALPRELIAQPGELFLFAQELRSARQPFFAADDRVGLKVHSVISSLCRAMAPPPPCLRRHMN